MIESAVISLLFGSLFCLQLPTYIMYEQISFQRLYYLCIPLNLNKRKNKKAHSTSSSRKLKRRDQKEQS